MVEGNRRVTADLFANQYSPMPKDTTGRMLARWRRYREIIGLEGELYFNMRQSGKSSEEIETVVREHREARASLLEDFHKSEEFGE